MIADNEVGVGVAREEFRQLLLSFAGATDGRIHR